MRKARSSTVNHRLGVTLVLLLVAGCAGSPPTAQPPADYAARIDALFERYATPGSPGVAVMVIHRGDVVHQAGYGLADVEAGLPITPATPFRLASVSKQFFAMATMILAEQGALAYDDPVTRFLPELERFGDRLTVRHLLQHTGGLPNYYRELEERFAGGRMPTNEDTLQYLAEEGQPLFAPGEQHQYSNPGYEILALVLERASGMPARELLDARIFAPLAMSASVVRDASEPRIDGRALGYARIDGELELDDDHRLNHIIGSGAIYSTLEDLYRWDQALYGDELVSRATLDEAFSPGALDNGETFPYGFGWGVDRSGALGLKLAHSGGWVGFSTHIARFPEQRFSVVVLSNLRRFKGPHYADQIIDLFFP